MFEFIKWLGEDGTGGRWLCFMFTIMAISIGLSILTFWFFHGLSSVVRALGIKR